jgi:hypothetical protein
MHSKKQLNLLHEVATSDAPLCLTHRPEHNWLAIVITVSTDTKIDFDGVGVLCSISSQQPWCYLRLLHNTALDTISPRSSKGANLQEGLGDAKDGICIAWAPDEAFN